MTELTEETVLDLAADTERLAHLECGVARQRPDEPMHALCGHHLVGVDAPMHQPRCPTCVHRLDLAGGGFAHLLGLARCPEHPPTEGPDE